MSRRPAKKKASPGKPPAPRRRDDCKLGADELPGVGHPEFDRELARAAEREEVARAREAQQFLPLRTQEDDMTVRPEGCTWWTQPHQTTEPAGRDRGRSLSTQIRHAAHRLGLDWEATRDELLVEWCVRQWGDLSCAQLAVTASVTIRLDEIADRAAEVTDEPTAQLLVQTALVRLGGLGKLRATDKHLGWLRDRVSLGTPTQRGANIGRMLARWGVELPLDALRADTMRWINRSGWAAVCEACEATQDELIAWMRDGTSNVRLARRLRDLASDGGSDA